MLPRLPASESKNYPAPQPTPVGTYLYIVDTFVPLNIGWGELVELGQNPMDLFRVLRRVIEKYLGPVQAVRHQTTFLNEDGEAVMEYLVEYALGITSVKIIYAKDPEKALAKYYNSRKEL